MIRRVCHIMDKKNDPLIAAALGWKPEMKAQGWNPYKVASLRGLYDQYRAEEAERGNVIPELNYNDPTSVAKTLSTFRSTLRTQHYARLNSGIKHVERCWDALRYAYSLHERNEAVNCISTAFSEEVDRLASQNGQVDRLSFVNGFTTTYGEKVGGEFSILEGVYNSLLQRRQAWYTAMQDGVYQESWDNWQKALKDGITQPYAGMPITVEEYRKVLQQRYEAYTKLLENWNELVPFALKDLVTKEGVKLGLNKEYAASATSDSFGENDLAAKWDISESKRDGWQENSDLISSFGSVGRQVRRILATTPQMVSAPIYKEGMDQFGNPEPVIAGTKTMYVVDSFGNKKFMDPVKTHQALEEVIHDAVDSEDMMAKLCSDDAHTKAKVAWMQGIVNVLNSSPQAKTQFFVDFRNNFQPYSMMRDKPDESKHGLRKITTIALNKAKNLLVNKYELSMSSKGTHPYGLKSWKLRYVFGEGKNGRGGLVDWERLAQLRNSVLEWTDEGTNGVGIFGQTKAYNSTHRSWLTDYGKNAVKDWQSKRTFLIDTLGSLGFDIDVDTADALLNSKDIYRVRDELEALFNPDNAHTGFLYAMLGEEQKNFKILCNSTDKAERAKALEALNKKQLEYKNLYKRRVNAAGETPIKQHSKRLLDIINKYQDAYKVESRVRYQDNTMFSYVAPSYLGDKLELIQSFVQADNKEGLLQYLNDEYLQSPFFVSDEYIATNGQQGRIYNTWLAEMVEACKNKRIPLMDSVISIFNYERDLGSEDKKFEDFTSKEHAIDMLVHFWADQEQNKSFGGRNSRDPNRRLSALYPIFILGDAGVSKYIRAPRITSTIAYNKNGGRVDLTTDIEPIASIGYEFDEAAEDRIINAFYDIYIQEKRRMAIDKAMSHTMYANGKPVQKATSSFSILTFLNPESQEYNDKYAISPNDEYKADKVKAVIREYLNDATLNGITAKDGRKIPSFKKRLEELSVLETTEVTTYDQRGKANGKRDEYKNLSSLFNPQNIDNKLKEFYWNTKLATAQQLQIMTIDPSFYHGTKDLQKRYKEIHAPGKILDVKAVDWDGNLFSEDGIERCIYFEDLTINAEEFNPEFMETILRTYAVQDKESVEKALREGILKPLTGRAENERQDKLKRLLGENYSLYKDYVANTLTDGQGFRTLTSYRKVMGMAGKWTRNMEVAYKTVMDIRSKHAADNSNLTVDELRLISDCAVVLQPIKPYMFTHEKYPIRIAKKDAQGNVIKDAAGNTVMMDAYQYIPVQHKYAEALIIPELMPKGNKLRDLALWMEAHDVDMAGSTKIAKVGCFGQANFTYKMDNLGQLLNDKGEVITKKDGTPLTIRDKNWRNLSDDSGNALAVKQSQDEKGLTDALSRATIHQLPYRDYRIQTNVPEHINASQLFGTQVRKLIMAGINTMAMKSEYLPTDFINLDTGEGTNQKSPLTGKNILAFYNSLICANIWESFEKFANNASDIEKLSDMLKQSTIGSTREAMDNLFSYVVTGSEKGLKKFFMPLFEGGLEHDTAALILSTFKKIVNKQQINGGSAVQVSAFGIKGYEEDGDLRFIQDPDNKANIIYAECEMPFAKHFNIDIKTKDGSTVKQKVELSFDKYCFNEGEHYGELIPAGEPLSKDNPEYKKYLPYTYKEVDGQLVPCKHTDPQAKVYKPLIETEFPGILSILAYRIPTERDYSMLNLKIKRFSSKMAGGTLKVPPQGTTIAGFDFDIDKLYFMVREYHKHFKEGAYAESNFSEPQKLRIWSKVWVDYPELYNALKNARNAAEEANPDLTKEFTLPTGKKRMRHLTTLNSYWEAAKIEETFGKNKNNVFAEAAQAIGEKPSSQTEDIEELEKYDFSLPPEKNTRAARNNMLISLIQARLSDPETVKQRYTPGGFKNASKAARLMRELMHGDLTNIVNGDNVDLTALEQRQDSDTDPEPNYDPTDPYTMLVYNQQNQVAGKLIGIFANQNTHHAFCSSMEKFELLDDISFCGHSYHDMLHKTDERAFEVDQTMAEFLAASVDAVKDPTLNFLNLNTLTADAGAMLARLGYTTKEIGLLFNQPIVLKVCQDAFNSNTSSTTALRNAITIAKEELANHLTGGRGNVKAELSANNLALSIIKNRQALEDGGDVNDFMTDDALMQNAVLDLFEDVVLTASDVSNFVLNTKFTASNAVKSTQGGLYAQQDKVANYLADSSQDKDGVHTKYCRMVVSSELKKQDLFASPISNNEEYLGYTKEQYLHEVRYNPFAYEQLMFDCNRKVLRLLSKYYPYERPLYSSARSTMQDLALYGSLTEEEINAIHAEIPVAALAKQTASAFNGEAAYVRDGKVTNLTNREYYREHFAEELSEMLKKHPNIGSYSLFKYISPALATKEVMVKGLPVERETYRLSIQDVGGLDSETKESIRESWAALMEVDEYGNPKDDDLFNIGKGLFMYCYYQMGFNFSPISFMHLAPTQVKDFIQVPRSYDLEINTYDTVHPNGDDVFVFSKGNEETELEADNYGAAYNDPNMISTLHNESFCWPETLTVNDVRSLIEEAISHPELKFKIAKDLTTEELALFDSNNTGYNVPSNIYFSKETKENMPYDVQQSMHYGRDRSYRQFLYEILDGKQMGMNINDFAQQFILNHLDNSKWVVNVDWVPNVKREVYKQLVDDNTLVDYQTGKYRSHITIDVSTLNGRNDKDVVDRLVRFKTNEEGEIISAKWAPVLKIGSAYYMADSGTQQFNMNQDAVMSYRKVVPQGTSKAMVYDNNQTLTSSMMYKSDILAEEQRGDTNYEDVIETAQEPVEESNVTDASSEDSAKAENTIAQDDTQIEAPKTGDNLSALRQSLENTIIEEYKKAYAAKGEIIDMEGLTKAVKNTSNEDLLDTVKDIMNATRENGVMVLDELGNPVPAC